MMNKTISVRLLINCSKRLRVTTNTYLHLLPSNLHYKNHSITYYQNLLHKIESTKNQIESRRKVSIDKVHCFKAFLTVVQLTSDICRTDCPVLYSGNSN